MAWTNTGLTYYIHIIYTPTWMWFEINVKVALMIAIDSPCYSRPRSLHTQVARYTGAHQLMTLGTSSKVIKLPTSNIKSLLLCFFSNTLWWLCCSQAKLPYYYKHQLFDALGCREKLF